MKLPAALRAWAYLARRIQAPGATRVAASLASRLLEPGRVYRSPDGLALRVDPGDVYQAAMVLGLYEVRQLGTMRRLLTPESTVIDVGGHLGLYALVAARQVGRGGAVHSFEPDPRLAARLREHVRLNRMDWVCVNELALAERTEPRARLYLADQLGWSSLVPGTATGATEIEVPQRSFDDYAREVSLDPSEISFIKIDVEGAELSVLQGMSATLRASRAAVMVEVSGPRLRTQGASPRAVVDLMAALGYYPRLAGVRQRRAVLAALSDSKDPGAHDVLFAKPPAAANPCRAHPGSDGTEPPAD
ncbi:MAG TPA: FkbM family methyltransferase [Solirubrobacteraceae bacterium]|jgi:FkbM family methyltransferase|nr:FkbM family methyltransferase [Solirubrobacteraceae bacterium]